MAKGARTAQIGALVAFALFLVAMDFLVWGRAFITQGSVRLWSVDDIRLFYSVPNILTLGLGLGLIPLLPRVRRQKPQARAVRLAMAGTSAMAAALIALAVLGETGNGSLPVLALAAIAAGAGIACMLLAWQSLFERLPVGELLKIVLGACTLFPLLAGLCLFGNRPVAYGVTLTMTIASAALLCLLGREDRLVQARFSADGAGNARTSLAGWGTTTLFLGSLGFVTGLSRTLTLNAVHSTSVLVFESLGCMLAAALVLWAIWRVRGTVASLTGFYRVAFFGVTTGLVAFSVVATDFTSSFAGLSYFFFELAMVLVIVESVKEARDRNQNPLVAYGFVAGCSYGLLGVGTAVGFVLQGLSATIPTFSVAVIVCLYALCLPFMLQTWQRKEGGDVLDDARDPSKDSGDVRELVHQKASDLGERYGLTPREIEILTLTVLGNDSPTIAHKLTLSDNTVRTHRKNLYRKLGVHSKQEIMELLVNL